MNTRPFAIVTGASSGIGLELAREAASRGCDLLRFDAMEKGDPGVIAGLSNKLRAALANVVPDVLLAEQHRKMTEPGSARN